MEDPKAAEQMESLFADAFGGGFAFAVVHLRVAPEDIVRAGKHTVPLTRRVACTTCKGLGREEGAPTCETCKGAKRVAKDTEGGLRIVAACAACEGRGHAVEHACKATGCEGGFTKEDVTVEVDLTGARPNGQIVIPGQGHDRFGEPRGDLYVVLSVDPAKSAVVQGRFPMVVMILLAFVGIAIALSIAR